MARYLRVYPRCDRVVVFSDATKGAMRKSVFEARLHESSMRGWRLGCVERDLSLFIRGFGAAIHRVLLVRQPHICSVDNPRKRY